LSAAESTTGIVLRARPFSETSLIVNWLTAANGRLSTVAKGARRPNSPLRGKLDLFYLADFSFGRSRRSDLHTLREAKVIETFAPLRSDLAYLQQASYCAALVEQSTEADTPLPGVYELMRIFLTTLAAEPAHAHTVFAFELKLLDELGLKPDLDDSRLSAGSRELAKALALAEWGKIGRFRPSEGQMNELAAFLHGYLIYHLGRFPKGREAAIAVERWNPEASSKA